MWSFTTNQNAQQIRRIAYSLQEKLLLRSLDPLQKAFADLALSNLSSKEIKIYIDLAQGICDDKHITSQSELKSFLDHIYSRLYSRPSVAFISPTLERILIRCCLITVLLLVIKGFHNISYYQICSFAIFFGSLLLFWLECKKKFYWTICITATIISFFNPIYKAHFNRQQWLVLDKWILGLLLVSVLIELLVLLFKSSILFKKRNRVGTHSNFFKRSLNKAGNSYNNIINSWPSIVIISTIGILGVLVIVKSNFKANDSATANAEQLPITKVEPQYMEAPYTGWDAVNLSTGDIPSGSVFKPKYGRLDNRLSITMGNNKDVAIKLINTLTQKCVRYVYIKAGETCIIKKVPVGHYYIKAAFGQNWMQKVVNGNIIGRFTESALYKQGEDDLYFYVDNGKVSGYNLRLDVADGVNNLNSHTIDEDEFNN